jgi:hypothetical protein
MDTNSKESVFNQIISLMEEMIKEIPADKQQYWLNKSTEVLQQLRQVLLNDDDSEMITEGTEQHQRKGINIFYLQIIIVFFYIDYASIHKMALLKYFLFIHIALLK